MWASVGNGNGCWCVARILVHVRVHERGVGGRGRGCGCGRGMCGHARRVRVGIGNGVHCLGVEPSWWFGLLVWWCGGWGRGDGGVCGMCVACMWHVCEGLGAGLQMIDAVRCALVPGATRFPSNAS